MCALRKFFKCQHLIKWKVGTNLNHVLCKFYPIVPIQKKPYKNDVFCQKGYDVSLVQKHCPAHKKHTVLLSVFSPVSGDAANRGELNKLQHSLPANTRRAHEIIEN